MQRAPRVGGAGRGKQMQLHLELLCDQDAPAAARDSLRQLEGIGWVLGDAMLVASELVSNAVRHSGAGADDRLNVDAEVRGDSLRITVVDPGFSRGVAQVRSGPDAFGGFGLRLVNELASRWGAERADGYRVWAELDLHGPYAARPTV